VLHQLPFALLQVVVSAPLPLLVVSPLQSQPLPVFQAQRLDDWITRLGILA